MKERSREGGWSKIHSGETECAVFSFRQRSKSHSDQPSKSPVPILYFHGSRACGDIARSLRKPVRQLDAWLIVGAQDSLENDLCGDEAEHPLELGLRLHHSMCGENHLPIPGASHVGQPV